MKRRLLLFVLAPIMAVHLSFAFSVPVLAADPTAIELQAPRAVQLGDTITVTGILRDGPGNPVPGATVILWTRTTFLGIEKGQQLGQATTDKEGRVSFTFQPRREGATTLNVFFAGDNRYASAEGSAGFVVQGSVQLYQEPAELQVPGIGVWILVALLGTIWSLYFVVMVLLSFIPNEGLGDAHNAGGRSGEGS